MGGGEPTVTDASGGLARGKGSSEIVQPHFEPHKPSLMCRICPVQSSHANKLAAVSRRRAAGRIENRAKGKLQAIAASVMLWESHMRPVGWNALPRPRP